MAKGKRIKQRYIYNLTKENNYFNADFGLRDQIKTVKHFNFFKHS